MAHNSDISYRISCTKTVHAQIWDARPRHRQSEGVGKGDWTKQALDREWWRSLEDKFAGAKGDICPECTENVFLVCGGNDVENIRSEKGMETLKSSYSALINDIRAVLPEVRINVISLIPRRVRDNGQMERMFKMNDFLQLICTQDNECYYIDIFSHFLKSKKLFYNSKVVKLNDKLYGSDNLHFSPRGNSVLAKVIIGVTYNPYT